MAQLAKASAAKPRVLVSFSHGWVSEPEGLKTAGLPMGRTRGFHALERRQVTKKEGTRGAVV